MLMVNEQDLLNRVECLKHGRVSKTVIKRMRSFDLLHTQTDREWFKELCFCILTANFTAEGGMKIQKEIDSRFLSLEKTELAGELKRQGHRFPNKRAEFIVEARKHKDSLKKTICSFSDVLEAREWMVKNIRGIGYKEASHFLRNVGYRDVAIIDRHVLNLLYGYQVIHSKPSSLTRKTYLEIENALRGLATILKLSLAELDLYLWFIETGAILK
jgi:N-glycosylase/DNA lyase